MEYGRKIAFAKNTVIMTVASMMMKLIGLYLNMQLARSLKAEGLGLYSLVMSVYVLASGISVSGMSVAVTRISSQELATGNEGSCRGVLRRCMFISTVLSICAGIIMVCMSRVISLHWLKDIRTVNSLCTIAFALPFVSMSAMFRGWYTARRKMLMPSVSQLFEQIIRLVSCMIIVPRIAMDAASGCLAVVCSDVIAEFAGCMMITVFYFASRKAKLSSPDNIGRRIFEHAVPITASHYLTSTLRTVESTLIPSCLVSFGLSRSSAISQLGMIHSMAVPLLFFPSAILTSAGALLIPEVVRYKALDKNEKVKATVEKALNLTVCFAVPVGAVFLMFAKEWGIIIYNEERLAMLLTALAPLVPLMYCETICTAILRGLGEQISLLKYNVTDGVLRLLLIILLVPRLGVAGILAVMIASNIFTPLMCFIRLRKITGAKDYIGSLVKSLACTVGSIIAVMACRKALSEIPDKADAVIFSVIFILLYGIAILCSTQKLKEAARRVCLQIPKGVRYISCRQVPSDGQAMHRARHNR